MQGRAAGCCGSCATHGLPLHPPAGLLRVISWTLNGLDVCTQNAVVRTSEDGQAHNTFWLTKRGTGGWLECWEAGLAQAGLQVCLCAFAGRPSLLIGAAAQRLPLIHVQARS